ncbi:MAG: hypothetical protein WBN30_02205, partial [Polyangiales bacterium]
MQPARPQLPSQPCPACGRAVDPLRAHRMLWLQDGARFFCGEACQARFRLGDRDFDAPAARPSERARVERPSIPDLVREATVPRDNAAGSAGDASRAGQYDPILATGLALLALPLIVLTSGRELGWLAAFLIALCAAVNARIPLRNIQATLSLEVVAPIGLVLACVAAVMSTDAETQRWSLVGAGVAAFLVSIRNWLHASLSRPLRNAAQALRELLPLNARVPAGDASVYEEVPAISLRQGDLVVVLEGERTPADGVIEEGSGLALRFPSAAHSRAYTEGDFILAGTRVLEGAVTVRVRRTGHECGIVRAVELGNRMQQDLAAASRVRFAVTHWSWLVLAPASIAALLWAGPAGAATFLLGVPTLALLASLDVAPDAGALASARRGMFFGSSRA